MDKKRTLVIKRRLTRFSVGCAVLSGIILLGAAVAEQNANSLKDEAQEAINLGEKVAEKGVLAQVIWEFSRAFRDLRDIESAVGVNPTVASTGYYYARRLAITTTWNGACGFLNSELGQKTLRTNLISFLPENSSVEAFNNVYATNQLELVSRNIDLVDRWQTTLKRAESYFFMRNICFFMGNIFALAALLLSFRAINFEV